MLDHELAALPAKRFGVALLEPRRDGVEEAIAVPRLPQHFPVGRFQLRQSLLRQLHQATLGVRMLLPLLLEVRALLRQMRPIAALAAKLHEHRTKVPKLLEDRVEAEVVALRPKVRSSLVLVFVSTNAELVRIIFRLRQTHIADDTERQYVCVVCLCMCVCVRARAFPLPICHIVDVYSKSSASSSSGARARR